MAYRPVAAAPGYSVGDERELVFAGFAAFLDPPQAETRAALRADGIEVKIVTGDNERVTMKICAEVGLAGGEASPTSAWWRS